MEFDTQRIINWGIGYLISLGVFIVFHKELPRSFKLYRTMFILGFLLLLFIIFYTAIIDSQPSLYFILDILLVKKVGIAGLRKLTLAAYLLMLWGVSLSIIVLVRDRRKENKNKQ